MVYIRIFIFFFNILIFQILKTSFFLVPLNGNPPSNTKFINFYLFLSKLNPNFDSKYYFL